MKLLLVAALASIVAAAPQGPVRATPTNEVQLLRFESDNDGIGTYRFAYEQSDGNKRDETGELKNAGTDDESIVVKGSYSWTGPDGIVYTVIYVADENGFQPTIEQSSGGAIPSAVVASLLG